MNAIQKNRCGYSGYTCKGLSRISPIELYADTRLTSSPSTPPVFLSDGSGKRNYNNFYNIPTRFCGSLPDIKNICGSESSCTANAYTERACALPDAKTVSATYYSTGILPVTVGTCEYMYNLGSTHFQASSTQHLDFTTPVTAASTDSTELCFWPGFIEPIIAVTPNAVATVELPANTDALNTKINALSTALRSLNNLVGAFSGTVAIPELVTDVKLGCISVPDIEIPAPAVPSYCGMASGADLYAVTMALKTAIDSIQMPDLSVYAKLSDIEGLEDLGDLADLDLSIYAKTVDVAATVSRINSRLGDVESDFERYVGADKVEDDIKAYVKKNFGKGIVVFDGDGGGEGLPDEYGIMYRNPDGIHAKYGRGVVYVTDDGAGSYYGPYFTIGDKGGELLATVGNDSGADSGLVSWVQIDAASGDSGGAGIMYRIDPMHYRYKSLEDETLCKNVAGYVTTIDPSASSSSGSSISILNTDGSVTTIETTTCDE